MILVSVDSKTVQQLSASGRHQDCLQACQQLLQVEPENPFSWKYAGKSLLALGQFEKAQQCLAKAHQLDTSDPETAKEIGNSFFKLGNKDDACKWYEKSLRINKDYSPAIYNLANLKRQSGNNQEAVNMFKLAIHVEPQFVEAYVGAAASYLTLGDLDQAELFATKAIEINAQTPGINEILGITFQNKKKSQQAVESYQRELAINPKSYTSLLNLGLLLLQQGKAKAAIESLSKAEAITRSKQCSLLLAQAYQSIGKLKEAIARYKGLDINQTQDKLIPFNLGLCLLTSGRNIEATEAFRIAIRLDESFLPAWGNIGTALLNEERHREALTAIKKVLELDPNDPTAHMNLGIIHHKFGRLDQALNSTLKSLQLKPDNPTTLINLGSIYKELGKLDQALIFTLKSKELNPNDPTVHINLGAIYNSLGNFDQALNSTLKSLELEPDNSVAHMNLGRIYKDQGDLNQALSYTLKSLELNPNNQNAHINLGIIHHDLGNLNQAFSHSLKSLDLNPNNPTAHMSLGIIHETSNELESALQYYMQSAELITKCRDENCITSLISASIILLQMNRIDDAKLALKSATKIASDNRINLKSASITNKKNNDAFQSFLSKLFLEMPNRDLQEEALILHLGESHCLTFAHQRILVKGKQLVIKPSLVKGAKAFHLSEETRVNPQKIGFEKRLQQNLDIYEHIFLSFGEIDCREDEGIILHCEKTGSKIEDIARETAKKYFQGTRKLLSKHKTKLVYFGTPAPFRADSNSGEITAKNKNRLLVIKVFNTTLKEQCQRSGTPFVDVYHLTAGEDGYNNDKWMIDKVHLKPKALGELIATLRS